MAIRPVDLQSSIFQQVQTAQMTQRAEQAAAVAGQVAQTQFADDLEERAETVHEPDNASGGRIDPKGEREGGGQQLGERRERGAFDEAVDEAAGLDGETHLIDFSA